MLEKFSKINNKNDLIKILNENEMDCQYISFIDVNGKQDFVYMMKHDEGFYSEHIIDGYVSYNKDKIIPREEIEILKNEMWLYEPFNDGVLYELEVYSVFEDFVKYPISNIEFLSENEVLLRTIQSNKRSFYDKFTK